MTTKINAPKRKSGKTIEIVGIDGLMEIVIGKGGWVSVRRHSEITGAIVTATIYSVGDINVNLQNGEKMQVIEINYKGQITNPCTGEVVGEMPIV